MMPFFLLWDFRNRHGICPGLMPMCLFFPYAYPPEKAFEDASPMV